MSVKISTLRMGECFQMIVYLIGPVVKGFGQMSLTMIGMIGGGKCAIVYKKKAILINLLI